MSLVNIINKVLKSDKYYNISKLGDNGVEFSAPGLFMGNFVLYDCEKNFIFLQGSRPEFKEDVTGLTWEEIAEKIIFKLDWRKRLGAIIYQPEDEKKELFCEQVKYEGKADRTLEEKLGSEEYKKFIEHCEELCNRPLLPSDIFNFPNTKPTYEDLEKALKKHKDILWKQFGISLMYDDKYYQRNEYKPKSIYPNLERCDWTWRPENEPFYVSNYCHSDIDNSKVEMYDAEAYMKYFGGIDPVGENNKCWIGTMSNFGCICYDPEGNISQFVSKDITVKQIAPDIQHIITPSKNYFLFKLS